MPKIVHPPMPLTTLIPAGQIQIPEGAREQPLSDFALSTRLANIFECAKIHRLGDLHGLNSAELACHRNFGPKTRREFRGLVQQVGGVIGKKPGSPLRQPYYIPKSARAINPFKLPISGRLAKLLTEKNIVRLRDLHGRKPIDMQGVRNCADNTISELTRLLQSLKA
jgi:hypothetical protein